MCCVMPPASPAATLDLRMTSSSEVLPWSTWPMMVTTGARGLRSSGLSSTSSSTFFSTAWTTPSPFARFSTSNLKPYFAQSCCGDFLVNRLVDGGENAQLDQIADDDERLLLELLGEFADDDRRLDDDDLGGVRQINLGTCRRGGFGRLARGLRRRAAIARALKLPARVRVSAARPDAAAACLAPPPFSAVRAAGRVGNWMNPTLSPIFGTGRFGRWRRWRLAVAAAAATARLAAALQPPGGGAVAVIGFNHRRFGLGFGWRRRRRGDENDFFLDGRGLGRFGRRAGAPAGRRLRDDS